MLYVKPEIIVISVFTKNFISDFYVAIMYLARHKMTYRKIERFNVQIAAN